MDSTAGLPTKEPNPRRRRNIIIGSSALGVGLLICVCLAGLLIFGNSSTVKNATGTRVTLTQVAQAPTATSLATTIALVSQPSATVANTTIAPTSTPQSQPTAMNIPPTAVPPTATVRPPTATKVPPTATLAPATATPRPPTATAIPPTLPPAAVPQQLAGRGAQAPTLSLRQGLALFRFRYSGTSNYIITLLDNDAKPVDLLVNTIGSYDGTKAFRIPANGDYTFNIESSGAWMVDVLQPGTLELSQNVPLPQTFSDQGPRVTQFFVAKTGSLRLTLNHDGKRNFIVILLNAQGQPIDLAANVIGAYSGTKVVRIPAGGVYLFSVEADGNWSIEATQ